MADLISAEKLVKHYQMGDETVRALDGVSFDIEIGGYAAIVGPSGSGKSTLMNILGGLDTPTGGRIVINGADMSTLDDEGLAHFRNQTIGFVFQSFNLLPRLTRTGERGIADDLCGATRRERIEQAREPARSRRPRPAHGSQTDAAFRRSAATRRYCARACGRTGALAGRRTDWRARYPHRRGNPRPVRRAKSRRRPRCGDARSRRRRRETCTKSGYKTCHVLLDADEARTAGEAGVDALVVQGVEAGGHRGSFVDADGGGEIGLLPLLRLVAHVSDLPLVATGGIADGAGVAAVLAAGARAAQIGTAFMCCPEAATSAAQRAALRRPGTTALTRAFTGRRARGIVNAFMRDHGADAPTAYPHVNALTAPLRAAARAAGDDQAFNLWAGQAHALIADDSAGDLVRRFGAEARLCLERAHAALGTADATRRPEA